MENKLHNIYFSKCAKEGRRQTEGQSSKFRELEKLLTWHSSVTGIWLECCSVLHCHTALGVVMDCALKEHVELCSESTEAGELAQSKGLMK